MAGGCRGLEGGWGWAGAGYTRAGEQSGEQPDRQTETRERRPDRESNRERATDGAEEGGQSAREKRLERGMRKQAECSSSTTHQVNYIMHGGDKRNLYLYLL